MFPQNWIFYFFFFFFEFFVSKCGISVLSIWWGIISSQCSHFIPLKTPENLYFMVFQRVSNGNIGQKWIKKFFVAYRTYIYSSSLHHFQKVKKKKSKNDTEKWSFWRESKIWNKKVLQILLNTWTCTSRETLDFLKLSVINMECFWISKSTGWVINFKKFSQLLFQHKFFPIIYLIYIAEKLFLSKVCHICQIYLYTMLSDRLLYVNTIIKILFPR